MTDTRTPLIIEAPSKPTDDDLQAFSEFLRNASNRSERDLLDLLQKHPAIVGVIGFCQFLAEFPLYKKDSQNQTILDDHRRRDRVDLLGARESPILGPNGGKYRSVHILELKRANLNVAARDEGCRLSDHATQAVEQLNEYFHWLTTVPENLVAIKRLGWDVRQPTLTLIMGSDSEFTDNPGQRDEMKARLLKQGIVLFTVDDVFRVARDRANTIPTTGLYIPRFDGASVDDGMLALGPWHESMDSFPDGFAEMPFREAIREIEQAFNRKYLRAVLEKANGNIVRASQHAGLDPKSFRKKWAEAGLEPMSRSSHDSLESIPMKTTTTVATASTKKPWECLYCGHINYHSSADLCMACGK